MKWIFICNRERREFDAIAWKYGELKVEEVFF